jgi:DNA (cytosine-5)-methyltransferase 1
MEKKLTFIDLFAGIGGFKIAFSNANAQCVMACEIDKFCQDVYRENYNPNYPIHSDITKLDTKDIANFDILCGGFPCQAFSLAGKKRGFDDTRGTLFFDVARILKDKKPKAFLLENVKNLVSHDKGNTFQVITQTLLDLGYDIDYKVINAKYFVPQNRERIFIWGVRKDLNKDIKSIKVNIEKMIENKIKMGIPHIQDILDPHVDSKFTLSDKLWSYLQSHAQKHSERGNGFGYGLIDPQIHQTTRTISARYYKDGSEILIKQEGKNPRKITPKEASKLQGYPESFKIVSSNTQAYKQFGNSVAVPVIEMLAKEIVALINGPK